MPTSHKPKHFPEQSQPGPPGDEYKMHPKPEVIREGYRGSGKLTGKVALITGGDSGIGRAVAVHFAREGADIAINYLVEERDALETKQLVEKEGSICQLIQGDLTDANVCEDIIKETMKTFNQLDILVNNAGTHFPKNDLKEVNDAQIRETF